MFKTSVMVTLLFLTASGAADKSLPQMRMTPAEIQASTVEDNQTGGSGVAGGHRKVLFGASLGEWNGARADNADNVLRLGVSAGYTF